MSNFKTVNAQQADDIHHYKNIKEKLHKTNAAILCNKLCRTHRLTPNCVPNTVSGTDRPTDVVNNLRILWTSSTLLETNSIISTNILCTNVIVLNKPSMLL